MSINDVLNYFAVYGITYLFIIVFLEYLNLPGLPAGIIMPAAGILIARNDLNFTYAVFISVVAGIAGSTVLYAFGRYFGKPILDKVYARFPRSRKAIDNTFKYINKYGIKGVFICRLIPVARTLISIVAGVASFNYIRFVIYSTLGITIWNCAFIYAGYAFRYIFL